MSVVVRCALALALLTSAALKLRHWPASRDALSTFSIPSRARATVLALLIVVEGTLGVGVAAGRDGAAYAAAVLCGCLAGALAFAIARGRAGAPCGCFGTRSSVTWAAVARSAALAVGFALVPSIPDGRPSTDGWLAIGLGLMFALVVALAVAVFALAREIGVLQLRLGAEQALELPDEGPPLGERLGIIERFRADGRTRFALAVFSSDGCRLCRALEPAVAAFRRDPVVAVEVFDEVRDAEVWRELEIPGSPFAVALGRDGAVGAKGTFNSYGQLESILATAERRLAEAHA